MLERILEICNETKFFIKPVFITLLIGSIFLDVYKIKVDPWKWILKKMDYEIGRASCRERV